MSTISEAMTTIRAGSHLDLKTFLSTHTRARPVRNKGNFIDDDLNATRMFEGKVVMICFFSLPVQSPLDSAVARAVSLVSSEMRVFGAFELVIIVNTISPSPSPSHSHSHSHSARGSSVDEEDDDFNRFMSVFPSFCCNRISSSDFIGLPGLLEPTGVLLNRNQVVEWQKPLNFFLDYGVDAFPFTSEMLTRVTNWEEDDINSILKADWMPLEYFLCSTPLPFPKPSTRLSKNRGGELTTTAGKMEISRFDRKRYGLTCLYLCYTGNLIPTLKEIEEKLCGGDDLRRRRSLEIVLVYMYMPFNNNNNNNNIDIDIDIMTTPQAFQDHIDSTLEERKVSWWVLPFVYWLSCRLRRLIGKDDVHDKLIILDPISKSTRIHGEAAILHSGVDLIISPPTTSY